MDGRIGPNFSKRTNEQQIQLEFKKGSTDGQISPNFEKRDLRIAKPVRIFKGDVGIHGRPNRSSF